MENMIQRLIDAIQQINNGFDWASAISSACSVISLIAIFILLKERKEKKRPYLQVSFELLRSVLVCLVIRNVGEIPAKLKGIKFNHDFVDQLPENGKEKAKDKSNLNISIYPKQQWVLCLDVITPDIIKYKNTVLEITLVYSEKGKNRIYTEEEKVNFNDYSGFLIYISETDELKKEIKELGNSLEKVEKVLNKITNINTSEIQTESYSNLNDMYSRIIVTENGNPEISKPMEKNKGK